jgi:hypothetical protein
MLRSTLFVASLARKTGRLAPSVLVTNKGGETQALHYAIISPQYTNEEDPNDYRTMTPKIASSGKRNI